MSLANIFDSHAHYDDGWFDDDREQVLLSLRDSGVIGVINCGCDLKSSMESVSLSEKYDFIYAAVGIHPHSAESLSDELSGIGELCTEKKVVAIGECGLDYYRERADKQQQLRAFEAQLELSNELGLPVIIHDRQAHADTLEALKKHRPQGVLHCFSGSVEFAKEVLSLGMYIGLGGVVTYSDAKKARAVAAMVPPERLLLETDCPYMAPEPFRRKRCNSALIAYTAGEIAALRGEQPQELIDRCTENTYELFKLSR